MKAEVPKPFGQTPEALEKIPNQCLEARSVSLPHFHHLGASDLVQLTKKTKSKIYSTYHFVTGVDTSSAASIAAYLSKLKADLGEYQLWFDRNYQWKVKQATYCTWNAFSKIDVHVTAEFPGGTKTYTVSPDGITSDKECDNETMWKELFMSSMMRCLLLKDNDQFYMEKTRHEYPFNKDGVKNFYECFEALYYRGPEVGASPLVQHATFDCNYMVDALFVLLDITGNCKPAIEMLGRLQASEILSKVLLIASQEVNAVSLMVNSVSENPVNPRLLANEAEFCLSKHKLDWALDCAKRAVTASPSDFYVWEVLCKVHIELEQWDQALLALNSAPLLQEPYMDIQKLAETEKVHQPIPKDGALQEVWKFRADTSDPEIANAMTVNTTLAKLAGNHLRGCFARAYDIIATIHSRIGWDALMKLRSELFWMEVEEFANEEHPEEHPGEHGGDHSDDHPVDFPNSGDSKPARESVRSKRLCERRLDHLFVAFFADIQYYVSWQREMVHNESQKLAFNKTSFEWYAFGNLAYRLQFHDKAERAYAKSLELFFNHRALSKLWSMDSENLELVVKMIAWQHRWYNEFSPKLMKSLRLIVAKEGLTKTRLEIEAMFGGQGVVDLMGLMLDRLAEQEVFGYDM